MTQDEFNQQLAAKDAEIAILQRQWNELDQRNEQRHREWHSAMLTLQDELKKEQTNRRAAEDLILSLAIWCQKLTGTTVRKGQGEYIRYFIPSVINAINDFVLVLDRQLATRNQMIEEMKTFANEAVCPVRDDLVSGFVSGAYWGWGQARVRIEQILDAKPTSSNGQGLTTAPAVS